MGGLAKLIGENEFPNQIHEGARESLYMTIVGTRVVLVVIFDTRTSLGLVRLGSRRPPTSWEDLRGAGEEDREPRAAWARRSPRSPTKTSTTFSASSDRTQVTKCPSSITHPARSTARSSITARSVREDDQPPVHLQQDQPRDEGQADPPRTETDRTLFFDFLPLSLGEIRGFKTRFHLYTVPGQVFYDASRKLILKGVDGVVFVADSQVERMEANLESFENLRTNLSEQGYDLNRIPNVVQYNKRDLPNAVAIEELR
jgi:signal recognition particle receptor subunit beta